MFKRSLKVDFLVKDCRNQNFLVDEGFVPLGKVPSRTFVPDFSKLVDCLDDIYALGELFKDMDDSQTRILIAALYNSSRLAKFNLHFAQPVYFNVSAPKVDYVDCWYKGYAVAAYRKQYTNQYKEKYWDYHIIALSNLKGKCDVVYHLMPENIVLKEEFKKHKKKLIREGKFRAPKKNLLIFEDMEWDTITNEDADAEELHKVNEKGIRRDLDSIEEDLINGEYMLYNSRKKKKKRRRDDGEDVMFTLLDERESK